TRIESALPGINCGACGSPSCLGYAERVASGKTPTNLCAPGGAEVAQSLADIMGVAAEFQQHRIAVVHCGAHDFQRTKKAVYFGIESCGAQQALKLGDIACSYGCLGKGDCFRACAFDAIEMKDGLPHIIPENCTACGKCVEACPRDIISLEPYDDRIGLITVACSSQDIGKVVRKICLVGCIACRLCVKTCIHDAFYMDGNVAKVDQEKAVHCDEWDTVIKKCPTNCIVQIGGQEMVQEGKSEKEFAI
ncbi:MAG: (Fe-S)-binding protein, partial [bacterium]